MNGLVISFVLRITALFVICIPCKIHLFNMLTRWAIALQSYDFTVEHKPGNINIIPDTLPRLFNFEHSEMRVAPHLAPICRNVTDSPALHGPPRLRPYQANSHNLDKI